jgi:ankyrin repeat protein
VDLLLQHGADVNARNRRNGKTCLHAACRLVPLDSGMIGYLLDKGADPGIVVRSAAYNVLCCEHHLFVVFDALHI